MQFSDIFIPINFQLRRLLHPEADAESQLGGRDEYIAITFFTTV